MLKTHSKRFHYVIVHLIKSQQDPYQLRHDGDLILNIEKLKMPKYNFTVKSCFMFAISSYLKGKYCLLLPNDFKFGDSQK